VSDPALPALPYSAWKQTKQTLHLYTQIVGKIKLATKPPRNHWWNVALHLDVRGLTTRRLTLDGTSFDLSFDFVDHRLILRTDAGVTSSFALEEGLAVAAFDANLHSLLREQGLDVKIQEQPYGMPVATPFPADEEHASDQRNTSSASGTRSAGSTVSSTSSPAGSAASKAPSTSSGTASTSPTPASRAAERRRLTPSTQSHARPTRTK
jgi:hypothetical protein